MHSFHLILYNYLYYLAITNLAEVSDREVTYLYNILINISTLLGLSPETFEFSLNQFCKIVSTLLVTKSELNSPLILSKAVGDLPGNKVFPYFVGFYFCCLFNLFMSSLYFLSSFTLSLNLSLPCLYAD